MKLVLLSGGLITLLIAQPILTAQSQNETPLVPYSSDYRFKDGLYLNIDEVRANDPIPLSRVVTNLTDYNKDFFDEMVAGKRIILYDENGVRAFVLTRDIWGYAEHGQLFIMLGGQFQRILIEGSISHFIASATTSELREIATGDTVQSYRSPPDPYSGFNYRKKMQYTYVTSEGKVSLFDFESNTLTGYDVESLGILLERDSVLHSEYIALRKRDRKKRMEEFIRRYNASHPLYLSGNQR